MKDKIQYIVSKTISFSLIFVFIFVFLSQIQTQLFTSFKEFSQNNFRKNFNSDEYTKISQTNNKLSFNEREYINSTNLKDFVMHTMKEKFFFYSPAGGLSNQETEILYSLQIGSDLDRSIIIPLISKHRSGWNNYANLNYAENGNANLLPVDKIINIDKLRKFEPKIKLYILNMTINEFQKGLTELDEENIGDILGFEQLLKIYRPKTRQFWKGTKSVHFHFGKYKEKFLMLKGSSMYHNWYNEKVTNKLQSFFSYSQRLLSFGLNGYNKIINDSKSKNINAVHVRLGDYLTHKNRFIKPDVFVYRLKKDGFDPKVPLYIATEEDRPDWYFKIFAETFEKLYFSNSTLLDNTRKDIEEYTQSKSDLSADIFGVVEQLICSKATKFRGTGYSNFSERIKILRAENGLQSY
eukprot:snap_masked-scaffold_37-processed-gene-1.33-mRNA-1 protein AED:1.00 eAED:1.00 QI:0/-1/0/0/-1/1/1/0/408